MALRKFKLALADELYGRFSLKPIMQHPAVVVIPCVVMSFGITELYALGLPLFVPSVDLMMTIYPTRHYCLLSIHCYSSVSISSTCQESTLSLWPGAHD